MIRGIIPNLQNCYCMKSTTSNPIFTFIFPGLLSGVLLGLSHSYDALFGLVFVALLPLLFALRNYTTASHNKKYLLLSFFVAVLVWQIQAISWLSYVGTFYPILISILNTLIFLGILSVGIVSSKNKINLLHLSFVVSWIVFEYLHMNWELAFPLIGLGNILAAQPSFIQWYEYTGVLGGTLWILLVNIVISQALHFLTKLKTTNRKGYSPILYATGISLIPVFVSMYLYYKPENYIAGAGARIMVVHPDVNCYTKKFQISVKDQIEEYFDLIDQSYSPDIDYALFPETAITDAGWAGSLSGNEGIISEIRDRLRNYDNFHLIMGGILYDLPKRNRVHPRLVVYSEKLNTDYVTYNAAMNISSGQIPAFRTKQELVPFEETIPYPNCLSGIYGLYKTKANLRFSARPERKMIFETNNIKSGTLICYESAFGHAAANAVKDGAQILNVILNEGWYNSPKGSRLFQNFSKMRAIETRRFIARSSNRGNSGFISDKGEVLGLLDEDRADTLTMQLPLKRGQTFYVRFGNYIGLMAFMVFCGIGLRYIFQNLVYRLRGSLS